MAKTAAEEAKRSWMCGGCYRPKSGASRIDAQIEDKNPGNRPLNIIFGFGLMVALKEFLEELGLDLVQRDLFLGKLYGSDGQQLLEKWVTFHGRYRLIIRGTKNVSHRRCDDCGRDVYFALGKAYLYPLPSEDADIFDSDLGLVLREPIFNRLNLNKWKKGLYIDNLSVPEKPLDGLGVLQ